MSLPADYPLAPGEIEKLERFPAISGAWTFSRGILVSLHEALEDEFAGESISIATAGSLGRLDACGQSDLDYMVISSAPMGADEYGEHVKRIAAIASPMKLVLPNPGGVFTGPTEIKRLADNIGKDEGESDLAHKMLLLMEARPLFNETLFEAAQDALPERYLAYLLDSPEKEALVLLNDVIRYFRTICINYQFTFWHQEEKWPIRNVKLRHSRLVMYAGLLFLIMNASKPEYRGNKLGYIKSHLSLTPIERIAHVYRDNDDYNIDRVLAHWDFFLRRITNADSRNRLQDIEYKSRYANPEYADLKINSDGLQSELTRFIWSRRGHWSSRVFEYLFF